MTINKKKSGIIFYKLKKNTGINTDNEVKGYPIV